MLGRFLGKMCFIVMKMSKSGPKIISSFFFMHNIISYLVLWWNVTWTCSWLVHVWMCLCGVCVTTNGKHGFRLWGRIRVAGSAVVSLCSVNGTSLFSVPGCYLGLFLPSWFHPSVDTSEMPLRTLSLTDSVCWLIHDGCPDVFDRYI